MRLARGGVKGNFGASAQRHAEGRDHYRLRRKLDGLRHALELADGEVDVVPFFFLHGHQQQHEVCADGEIRRVIGDDEGVEVVAGAAGLERLRDQGDDVGAERVHLGVELDAATPSPRSTRDAPEFFLTTPLDFFATVTDQTPAGT